MITNVEKIYLPGTDEFIFRITEGDVISDVPNNEENRHYQAIQEWIAEGGTVIDNPPE